MQGGRCPVDSPLMTLFGGTLQDPLPGEVGEVHTLHSTSEHFIQYVQFLLSCCLSLHTLHVHVPVCVSVCQ